MSERNELDIERIAQLFTRFAELHSDTAEVIAEIGQAFRGLAKANANLRTGRKVHRAYEPTLEPVSGDIKPLLDSANRLRVARRRSAT